MPATIEKIYNQKTKIWYLDANIKHMLFLSAVLTRRTQTTNQIAEDCCFECVRSHESNGVYRTGLRKGEKKFSRYVLESMRIAYMESNVQATLDNRLI